MPYEPAAALAPVRPVYWCGSGPPVIVLHEIPGATPELFRFAYRIAQTGFTAFVPILFGEANHPAARGRTRWSSSHACACGASSACWPPTARPRSRRGRATGELVRGRLGGPGIGAVSLCVTGSLRSR